MRVFSETPLNPDQLPRWVRIRPDIHPDEADRIAHLPEVGYAAIWTQVFGRLEYRGTRTQQVIVYGADDRYSEIMGGELSAGRWFTRAELAAGSSVVVIDEDAAARIFGRETALDKTIAVLGRPARVVGVYLESANIFRPPGQEMGASCPIAWRTASFASTARAACSSSSSRGPAFGRTRRRTR